MNEALRPDDTRDALRNIGGLLFGAGVLMLVLRKSGDWGDFALLLAYLVPAVLLYGGSVMTLRETGGLRPWQAVFSVFGLLFVVLTLQQLVDWIGDPGDSGSSLNVFWIFGVITALALYAAIVAGIRFQLLVASVAFAISFLALWDKIVGFGDDLGVFRGFLGIVAIILLAGGIRIWRTDPDAGLLKFSEMFTAAGVAAVAACALGITSDPNFGAAAQLFGAPVLKTTWYWDTALLVIALGLIGAGTRIGVRGPVYVGGIGLLLFVAIAGADLDAGQDADPTKIVGWPLFLILAGAAGVLVSLTSYTLGDRPREWIRNLSGR